MTRGEIYGTYEIQLQVNTYTTSLVWTYKILSTKFLLHKAY
jgi:hypothetical protein